MSKKKPVKKSVKYDGPMTAGMKFFLAGCVAQLYLLIVNRFYINGTIDQMLSWNGYLKTLAVLGAVAAAVGAVLLKKVKNREIAWYGLGGGAFVAVASALVYWNMQTLSALMTVVPVVLVVDVLWWLFDRDSALSLSILAAALVVVWLNRRADMMAVKALTAALLVALVALLALAKKWKIKSGAMLYASCAIGAVGAVTALVSAAAAYYAMWVLAAAMFCMAVYYTVKQL